MDYKKWLSLIGVIIFVYILWHIGWTDLTSSFKKINLFYFLIAVLMVVPLLMLYTYKWFVILKLQGFKVPFFRLFLISLIGIYYGSITPSRGGAIIRSVYLKDYCKENKVSMKKMIFPTTLKTSAFKTIVVAHSL